MFNCGVEIIPPHNGVKYRRQRMTLRRAQCVVRSGKCEWWTELMPHSVWISILNCSLHPPVSANSFWVLPRMVQTVLHTTIQNWIFSRFPTLPFCLVLCICLPSTCPLVIFFYCVVWCKGANISVCQGGSQVSNIHIGMWMWLRVSVGGLDVVKVIQGDLA